jgi:hypothetical protein
MPGWGSRRAVTAISAVGAVLCAALVTGAPAAASDGRLAAGGILRVHVPEAIGGKTVVGQLTVDLAVGAGFVTAYPCDDGIPRDGDGDVARSDLNYDGQVSPVASNRLVVEADDDGDVCFYTLRPAALIVDVNAATFDTGITSFPNRRTDTRDTDDETVAARGVLRVSVPEAAGGKTLIGQLTVDRVTEPGYVTAFPCDLGIPKSRGEVGRSDLNYDGRISPVASNRLVVAADDDGDVCFYTLREAAIVVDVNGIADAGIESFRNERTDTRDTPDVVVDGGGFLRVNVPRAVGRKTVIGQLTVDRATAPGYVTAYGCDDGIPKDDRGAVARSDLNYDGTISPVASNRLVVQADADGDVCFATLRTAAIVVDVNGISDIGIQSFPNRRTDTRSGSTIELPGADGQVPAWPEFTPKGPLASTAALTGLAAGSATRNRGVLAVKIDNYRLARPQWGLEQADAIIEENVEGVTRFVALFHSTVPAIVGPVRSARTGDLDLLTAMNRPVFAFSGANAGTTAWIDSAESSGVLVDFSALVRPCYAREPSRPGPHNLLLDAACAYSTSVGEGAARPLWRIDGSWTPAADVAATADTTFAVEMDGVDVGWTWDAASRTYLRSQDGVPHLTAAGTQLAFRNVVELRVVHVPSPVDARTPNPITVGTGDAVVHRDGRAIPAIWSRATAYDPFELFDRTTGTPIPLDTGTTFIELARA